jgi:hypothetical protein
MMLKERIPEPAEFDGTFDDEGRPYPSEEERESQAVSEEWVHRNWLEA